MTGIPGTRDRGHSHSVIQRASQPHAPSPPLVRRSPAVVCAWAMHSKRLSCQDALARLQSRHKGAEPNEGFLAQLELWGAMGNRVDRHHPGYRR